MCLNYTLVLLNKSNFWLTQNISGLWYANKGVPRLFAYFRAENSKRNMFISKNLSKNVMWKDKRLEKSVNEHAAPSLWSVFMCLGAANKYPLRRGDNSISWCFPLNFLPLISWKRYYSPVLKLKMASKAAEIFEKFNLVKDLGLAIPSGFAEASLTFPGDLKVISWFLLMFNHL